MRPGVPQNYDLSIGGTMSINAKSAAKDAEDAKKQQQLEDEYWRDDDKQVLKKQQRKVFNQS